MPEIDVTSAQELGHLRWTDKEQPDYATREGRIILTEDRKDFSTLSRRYTEDGSEYAGIARSLVRFEREHPLGAHDGFYDYLRPV